MKKAHSVLLAVILLAAALSSCAPQAQAPPPTPTASPEPVPPTPTLPPPTEIPEPTNTPLPPVYTENLTLETEDGVLLSAKIIGEGPTAIILLHMSTGSQRDWLSFALPAGRSGYTTLSIDMRGHGNSGGGYSVSAITQDVTAAVAFLQERGFETIICAGASMGASTCLWAAFNLDIDGLVFIASDSATSMTQEETLAAMPGLTIPSIFIVGAEDALEEGFSVLYQAAPEPKELFIFDTPAHGTAMLATQFKDEFTTAILDFLASFTP